MTILHPFAGSLRRRLRVLFCRHLWAIHLCRPPSGVPSLVICDRCSLVRECEGDTHDR